MALKTFNKRLTNQLALYSIMGSGTHVAKKSMKDGNKKKKSKIKRSIKRKRRRKSKKTKIY